MPRPRPALRRSAAFLLRRAFAATAADSLARTRAWHTRASQSRQAGEQSSIVSLEHEGTKRSKDHEEWTTLFAPFELPSWSSWFGSDDTPTTAQRLAAGGPARLSAGARVFCERERAKSGILVQRYPSGSGIRPPAAFRLR